MPTLEPTTPDFPWKYQDPQPSKPRSHGAHFVVEAKVALFHKGMNLTQVVREGRRIKRFPSRKEAALWIEQHPFTGDPYDVIRGITYKVKYSTDQP